MQHQTILDICGPTPGNVFTNHPIRALQKPAPRAQPAVYSFRVHDLFDL